MNKKVLVGTVSAILGGITVKVVSDLIKKRKENIQNEVEGA